MSFKELRRCPHGNASPGPPVIRIDRGGVTAHPPLMGALPAVIPVLPVTSLLITLPAPGRSGILAGAPFAIVAILRGPGLFPATLALLLPVAPAIRLWCAAHYAEHVPEHIMAHKARYWACLGSISERAAMLAPPG